MACRHDYRGCSSLIDANLTSSVYAFWRERALEVNEATGAVQTFTIQHVAASLVDYGNQKGGNPLSLPTGTDLQCKSSLTPSRPQPCHLPLSPSLFSCSPDRLS